MKSGLRRGAYAESRGVEDSYALSGALRANFINLLTLAASRNIAYTIGVEIRQLNAMFGG